VSWGRAAAERVMERERQAEMPPIPMLGTWLATRTRTHWFYHNANEAICRQAKREEILLGYLHVNHCKKCMTLVARMKS